MSYHHIIEPDLLSPGSAHQSIDIRTRDYPPEHSRQSVDYVYNEEAEAEAVAFDHENYDGLRETTFNGEDMEIVPDTLDQFDNTGEKEVGSEEQLKEMTFKPTQPTHGGSEPAQNFESGLSKLGSYHVALRKRAFSPMDTIKPLKSQLEEARRAKDRSTTPRAGGDLGEMKRMAAEAQKRAVRNHNFLKSTKPQKPKPAWNSYNSPELVPRTDADYKKGAKQHKEDYRQRVASALKQRQEFKEKHFAPSSRQPVIEEFKHPSYHSNEKISRDHENDPQAEECRANPPRREETPERLASEEPGSVGRERVVSPDHQRKISDLKRKYIQTASGGHQPLPRSPMQIPKINFKNLPTNHKEPSKVVRKNKFQPLSPASHRGMTQRSGSSADNLSIGKSIATDQTLNTQRYGTQTSMMSSSNYNAPRNLRKSVLTQEMFQKSSLINDNPIKSEKKPPTSPRPKSSGLMSPTRFQQAVKEQSKAVKNVRLVKNLPDATQKPLPNKQMDGVFSTKMEHAKKNQADKPSEVAKREQGIDEPRLKKHALVLDPKKVPKRKAWEQEPSVPVDLTIIKEEQSVKISRPPNMDNYDMEIELQMFQDLEKQVKGSSSNLVSVSKKKLTEERPPEDYMVNRQHYLSGPHYSSLPSVKKQAKDLSKYGLRTTLNQIEPQMQKFKMRTTAKSYYQKQTISTFVAICTEHSDRLFVHIFKYLERPSPTAGPGLHVFKLAMLNSRMNTLVRETYGIESFGELGLLQARSDMIQTFQEEPCYLKYQQNKRFIRNLGGAWKNPVFGGSVLSPIMGAATGIGGLKERRIDGKKIEKKNALKQLISDIPLEPSEGAGFYHLKNIRTAQNTFLDIQILIPGGIKDKKDQRKIRDWHNFSRYNLKIVAPPKNPDFIVNKAPTRLFSPPPISRKEDLSKVDRMVARTKERTLHEKQEIEQRNFRTLAQSPDLWSTGLRVETTAKSAATKKAKPVKAKPERKFLDAEDVYTKFDLSKDEIRHMLNGFARVVEFGTSHIDKRGNYNPTVDPNQNYVICVSEGYFKFGQFSGYVRCLDNEGECKVGFWKLDTSSDAWHIPVSRPWGKFAHYYKDGSFKSPDGIYLGNDDMWNYLQKKKAIYDYLKNERPHEPVQPAARRNNRDLSQDLALQTQVSEPSPVEVEKQPAELNQDNDTKQAIEVQKESAPQEKTASNARLERLSQMHKINRPSQQSKPEKTAKKKERKPAALRHNFRGGLQKQVLSPKAHVKPSVMADKASTSKKASTKNEIRAFISSPRERASPKFTTQEQTTNLKQARIHNNPAPAKEEVSIPIEHLKEQDDLCSQPIEETPKRQRVEPSLMVDVLEEGVLTTPHGHGRQAMMTE